MEHRSDLKMPLYSRVTHNEHSAALKIWQVATVGPHQLMLYPRIVRALKKTLTPASLLGEFGSGVGFVMEAIVSADPPLPYRLFLGLEINRESRMEARELVTLDQAGIVECDITDSHFPDGMFDVAVCSTVLCHFKPFPLRQALFHSIRMLSPGGTMIVCVPSVEWVIRENTDYVVLEELGPKSFVAVKQGNPLHLRQSYYAREVYEGFLRDADFKIVESEEITIPDIDGIGVRYRKYAGTPLFYFFSVERPQDFKVPETELYDKNIPEIGG
uniref:Methyltransferase domain-containing protein n=1 Tax=Candidatus Kentrum sp. FM TaxID=2126340 RepID=A0A450VT33_9GAMM|nr:MAG: Methyltransferase domain-containing protein [Candidatus Kentron sp. FM]VFJ47762.1 MAG: Methyltransferase domain-containing protein [Candidatus Kentron sp. FM]VFK07950.1 MAG: Methyltransferase domain-containing protein [Candidatus Kentron sp. FM]